MRRFDEEVVRLSSCSTSNLCRDLANQSQVKRSLHLIIIISAASNSLIKPLKILRCRKVLHSNPLSPLLTFFIFHNSFILGNILKILLRSLSCVN